MWKKWLPFLLAGLSLSLSACSTEILIEHKIESIMSNSEDDTSSLYESNESISSPGTENPNAVGEFRLSDYKWEMETYPSDKNVGPTNDAETAIQKAKELYIEKFSVINGQTYDPLEYVKISIAFDENNQCWLITGTLPPDMFGAVPMALIQKDGKVLAVWMG